MDVYSQKKSEAPEYPRLDSRYTTNHATSFFNHYKRGGTSDNKQSKPFDAREGNGTNQITGAITVAALTTKLELNSYLYVHPLLAFSHAHNRSHYIHPPHARTLVNFLILSLPLSDQKLMKIRSDGYSPRKTRKRNRHSNDLCATRLLTWTFIISLSVFSSLLWGEKSCNNVKTPRV